MVAWAAVNASANSGGVAPLDIVYFATATVAIVASYAKSGNPKSGVLMRRPTA